jgi:hypothetical protein
VDDSERLRIWGQGHATISELVIIVKLTTRLGDNMIARPGGWSWSAGHHFVYAEHLSKKCFMEE